MIRLFLIVKFSAFPSLRWPPPPPPTPRRLSSRDSAENDWKPRRNKITLTFSLSLISAKKEEKISFLPSHCAFFFSSVTAIFLWALIRAATTLRDPIGKIISEASRERKTRGVKKKIQADDASVANHLTL